MYLAAAGMRQGEDVSHNCEWSFPSLWRLLPTIWKYPGVSLPAAVVSTYQTVPGPTEFELAATCSVRCRRSYKMWAIGD